MDPMDLISWLMGRPRPSPYAERLAEEERNLGLEMAPPAWASSAGPATSPDLSPIAPARPSYPLGPTAAASGPQPQFPVEAPGPAPFEGGPAPVVPFSVANAAAQNPMARDFPSFVNPQSPLPAQPLVIPQDFQPAGGPVSNGTSPFQDLRERQLLSGQVRSRPAAFSPRPSQPVPLPVANPREPASAPTRKPILPFAHSVPETAPFGALPMIMGGQPQVQSQVPVLRGTRPFQAPAPVPDQPRPQRAQAPSPPAKRAAPAPAPVPVPAQPSIAPEPKPPQLGEAMPEALKQQLLAEAIALSKARRQAAANAQSGAQTAAGVAR